MNQAGVEGRAAEAGHLEEGRGADLLALCLMLFMVMNSVAMSLMPIVQDDLQKTFSFSSSQIGFLTSIFMLAFALGAIPMGLAAVRWGGRTLIAGVLVFAVGSALFAFSASYEWFLVGRLLQGVGGSTVIPVSNHLMTHTIAPRRQARALGIFGTGHGLGVVAALLIMPSVQAAGGYRAVFLVTAGIGVALAAVAAAQRHIRAGAEKGPGEATAAALLREVGSVATTRRLWLLAVINIGVMAIVVGILAWTPAFLHDQRNASLAVAAYLTAGVGVAQMLGNIAGAAAMARWGKAFVLLSGMAVMLVATALAPLVPGFVPVIACVVVAGFLTMAVFPAIMGSVPDIVRRRQVGAATGFLNLTNLLGTLFAPWVFGVLLDTYGTGPRDEGYLAGYLWLALFPLLGTVAAVIFMATRRSARASAEARAGEAWEDPAGPGTPR